MNQQNKQINQNIPYGKCSRKKKNLTFRARRSLSRLCPMRMDSALNILSSTAWTSLRVMVAFSKSSSVTPENLSNTGYTNLKNTETIHLKSLRLRPCTHKHGCFYPFTAIIDMQMQFWALKPNFWAIKCRRFPLTPIVTIACGQENRVFWLATSDWAQLSPDVLGLTPEYATNSPFCWHGNGRHHSMTVNVFGWSLKEVWTIGFTTVSCLYAVSCHCGT